MLRVKFCANRKKAHRSHLKKFFLAFSHSSKKYFQAEVGVAYMGRCSTNSCMRGYKVFECARKYAGVISVTDFA